MSLENGQVIAKGDREPEKITNCLKCHKTGKVGITAYCPTYQKDIYSKPQTTAVFLTLFGANPHADPWCTSITCASNTENHINKVS